MLFKKRQLKKIVKCHILEEKRKKIKDVFKHIKILITI